MDLIGKTIMNTDFHAQRGYNVLADSMVSQIRWHEPDTAIDPLSRIIVKSPPDVDVKPEKLDPDFKAMRKAIEEHDLVFGRQVDGASELLETKPHLANDLPYTTAVIKETLRHFHAASSSRQGYPGVNLYDEQGTACPANHTVCFTDRVGMHYAPKYWVRPEEFLPERWLVDPGHEL
ncbi:cytochrome p450 71b25 [Botrytis cinerea]